MSLSPEIPTDPTALADEIACTTAHLDAATHRLLTCIRAFDASEEWGHQGALSCAHWLCWRIGLTPGTAREKVRVARALGALPLLDHALRRGAVSYSKIRAVTRVATPLNEPVLLDMAKVCTGAQLERLCRGLRRARALTEEGDRLHEHRTVREEVLETGMVRLTITLHPDEAALVMKAINHARHASGSADDRPSQPRSATGMTSQTTPVVGSQPPAASAPHQAAPANVVVPASAETRSSVPMVDALVAVAEAYLAHTDSAGRGGTRTQIFVHLDQDPLSPDGTLAAALDDGTRVSAEGFRRLSCDAALIPVHHTATGPQLDLGRRTRTISPALRRALNLRDRSCRFPGCSNSLFVHAHHIQHWAHGGPTNLANLLSLCTRHHTLLHEGGFSVRRTPGGDLAFTDPHGRPIAASPLPSIVDGEGADTVSAWNDQAGLEIDAQTAFPGWDGERIDYLWALDAVCRLGFATTGDTPPV